MYLGLTPGTINTGDGNDILSGVSNSGASGIVNTGIIDTGNGREIISGVETTSGFSTGISNSGSINTGADNDIITGIGHAAYAEGYGIVNTGTIDTGDGNDIIDARNYNIGETGFGGSGILNSGIINTGNGDDEISGSGSGDYTNGYGIENLSGGIIDTGAGNDKITGSGNSFGIYNDGTINTGDGSDIVDALTGGFIGDGTINLGNGNDVLKGFGSGLFDGGMGFDMLRLGSGTYTVSATANSDGFYTLSNGTTDMFLQNFELIGSASNPAATFSFSSVIGGTFTV